MENEGRRRGEQSKKSLPINWEMFAGFSGPAQTGEEIGFAVDTQVPGEASKLFSFINRGLPFPHVPVTYLAFMTLILQSDC